MQDRQSREAGDARLRVLSSGWIARAIVAGSALTVICMLILLAAGFLQTSGDGPRALDKDFRVFWAAGHLALSGDLLGVFDNDRLAAIHAVNPENWMPWLYPPAFLIALAPLGTVSFAVGYAAVMLLSVGLLAAAVRPFTRGAPIAWAAFSLAPAYLPILAQGQNGLIWLAGLLAAFAALRDGRWVLAGIFIGLLTLKPQFGLLIPVALIAAGLWRTTIVATLTAVVAAALPTLATGPAYWGLLLERMSELGQRVVAAIQSLSFMASPFAFFVRLGVPPDTALNLQFGVTIAAAVAVFVIWRSRRADFDVKAAALLAGSLLASPYAWHYEAAIMAPVGLFLVRAGLLDQRAISLVFLAMLLMGTSLQTLADIVADGVFFFRWALFVTPLMVVSVILCLFRLRQTDTLARKAA
jgi:arabinofuranan 3-O-arabinosyltransferase